MKNRIFTVLDHFPKNTEIVHDLAEFEGNIHDFVSGLDVPVSKVMTEIDNNGLGKTDWILFEYKERAKFQNPMYLLVSEYEIYLGYCTVKTNDVGLSRLRSIGKDSFGKEYLDDKNIVWQENLAEDNQTENKSGDNYTPSTDNKNIAEVEM